MEREGLQEMFIMMKISHISLLYLDVLKTSFLYLPWFLEGADSAQMAGFTQIVRLEGN